MPGESGTSRLHSLDFRNDCPKISFRLPWKKPKLTGINAQIDFLLPTRSSRPWAWMAHWHAIVLSRKKKLIFSSSVDRESCWPFNTQAFFNEYITSSKPIKPVIMHLNASKFSRSFLFDNHNVITQCLVLNDTKLAQTISKYTFGAAPTVRPSVQLSRQETRPGVGFMVPFRDTTVIWNMRHQVNALLRV